MISNIACKLCMFYVVHFTIITNENQQNAQMIYICAFVQGVIVYKYILQNPNIVRYVDN